MHCSYFGQILQTVWPHPVIEGSGKNRLVMFISITDGALSFSLSQVQKLSWYSNEIIYHCEEKSILYNFLFQQWWNKSVKLSYITVYGLFFALLHLQFRPLLNLPQYSCVHREIIWDIGIHPVLNSIYWFFSPLFIFIQVLYYPWF